MNKNVKNSVRLATFALIALCAFATQLRAESILNSVLDTVLMRPTLLPETAKLFQNVTTYDRKLDIRQTPEFFNLFAKALEKAMPNGWEHKEKWRFNAFNSNYSFIRHREKDTHTISHDQIFESGWKENYSERWVFKKFYVGNNPNSFSLMLESGIGPNSHVLVTFNKKTKEWRVSRIMRGKSVPVTTQITKD